MRIREMFYLRSCYQTVFSSPDFQPDNVFIARRVSEEGVTEEFVKVLDFGIAKLLQLGPGNSPLKSHRKTLAGTQLGTALYMAPEQLEGREAGKHSDVYALGLLLIEMITGRLPWGRSAEEADTVMTMMRLVTPPKPLAELVPGQAFSAEMQAFFDDVLAIDPARRPQDAGDMLKRLAQIPEAAFLARSSGGRSEISRIFSSAFVNAALQAGLESERVANAASAATDPTPVTSNTSPGDEQSAEPPGSPESPDTLDLPNGLGTLDTIKTTVPRELLRTGPTDLPSVPTVVKSSSSGRPIASADAARSAPLQMELTRPRSERPSQDALPATLPLNKAIISESARARLSDDQVTPPRGNRGDRGPISAVKTMPVPMPAPKVGEVPPTVPLPLARLLGDQSRTAKGLRASDSTFDTSLGSSQTMRTKRRQRSWFVVVILLLIAVVLAAGYAALQLHFLPLPTPVPTISPTEVARAVPPPAAPLPSPPKVEALPSVSVSPVLTEAIDPAAKRRPRSEEVAVKSAAIQVSFRVRKPDSASITCGSDEQRPCEGSCSVSPGEQCVIKSAGYGTKRFGYDELERRVRRGKSRIDVSLSPTAATF